MENEGVPIQVAANIAAIVKGQQQTAAQLNSINKSLAEIEQQQEYDLKALSDTFTALKTFNDTLSVVNNQFDEMNRAVNSHFETQIKMEISMNEVTGAQKSTCDLYAQIIDDIKKQKIVLEECVQEMYSGTINLLQKQQRLGESFNQIRDALEIEKETWDSVVNRFKEALHTFPADLHKVYGK